MKRTILGLLALAGLSMTLIPALFVFNGNISIDNHKTLMALGMLIWFVAAPFWIKRER